MSQEQDTRRKVNDMENRCIKNTTKFSLMLEEIQKDISEMSDDIKSLKRDLKNNYISQKEFKPYKDKLNKVYGFIWGLLLSCGAIIVVYILKSVGLPMP